MLKLIGLLFLSLTIVDLGIKQYIEENFENGEERETRVSKLVLRKIYNKGFAFHTLDRYPWVIRWTSIILGVAITIYDVWLALQKGRWLEKVGMAFLSAGAVSNIYDRLVRGKVIDYIGFKSKWKKLRTTTPNLADFYVAIGAIAVLIARALKR